MIVAQPVPHGANADRAEAVAQDRARVLTLNHPQPGNTVTHDAEAYGIVDLRLIAGQWIALVQIGRTLKIVFADGSVIELLNFFSFSLLDEASPENGTTGSASDDPSEWTDTLVRTADAVFMSSKDFARSYWVTKSSGAIALPSGEQSGTQNSDNAVFSPDIPPLSFPPDALPAVTTFVLFGLGPEFFVVPARPTPPPSIPNSDPCITAAAANGSTSEDALVPAAAGTIEFDDLDADDVHAVSVSPGGAGYVGTFTATLIQDATAGGTGMVTWDFSSDPADLQFLAQGQRLVQVYTVTIADGRGGSVVQVVAVTIEGTNDAAIITGDAVGTVTEAGGTANASPGIPAASGDLDAADVDNPADAWIAVTTPTLSLNGYGSFTLTAAGVWTYTLDNTHPAVQALNVGATLNDSFTVTTIDGTPQVVTITIEGANDTAVITGDTTGSTLEAGGVANDIPGTPTASGDLAAADVDNPNDSWVAVLAPTPSANGYGTFTVSAAGVWTYMLDNANAAVEALALGSVLTDSFAATTLEGTTQVVTVTIIGANDTPVVTGAVDSATVIEGDLPVMVADGTIDFGDVDLSDAHVTSVTPGGSGYFGIFVANVSDDSTGDGIGQVTWRFVGDNLLRRSIGAGQVLVQTYTVEIDDGHGGIGSQLVTITIEGTNDAAVITGDTAGATVEAGGVGNTIPGTPTDSGNLDATDVDDPPDSWAAVGSPTPSERGYGTFTLTADGVWTYTLDNTNATVQTLKVGATLTDSFTAATVDGTTQVVSVTITGTNDAAVISGPTDGTVVEAGGIANGSPGTLTATGNLDAVDVDDPDNSFAVVDTPTPSLNGYGAFTITAVGAWVYTLDNTHPAVQALNVGATLTDSFTVSTIDGTTQVVSITIEGMNDAAVIVGDNAGVAVEAGGVANAIPGSPSDSGDLDATDLDNPNDSWVAVLAPTLSLNGYGRFTLTSAGVWTYTLDNANATVQALNAGDTLTDSFAAITVDGTVQVVTFTIEGANDAAVISGPTTGSVVEAGGVANGTPGTPTVAGNLDAADVDDPDNAFIAVATPAPSLNGYGSFTITAAGAWIYTLDNTHAAVQGLNVGETLTDSFTVTTVDNTAQVVTITIEGANDAAVITGVATATVAEAGGVANGTPGTPSATGDLNAADVDDSQDSWIEVPLPILSANGYGSVTLTAAGVWTYTLDDTNGAVQALNLGGTLTDGFTVTTVDGTAEVVTITIEGANDAAVISGPAAGTVVEASSVANGTPGTPSATGNLDAVDVDDPDNQFTVVDTPTLTLNGYGSFTVSPFGVWTYTLNDANADVQALNAGATLTDSFTVTTVDGTAQVVTITIEGANDAAVITGDNAGATVEAGGVDNDIPGTPTDTGDLDAADVDNPNDSWSAVLAPTLSLNGYGSFTLSAAGVWAYTLDNTNATVEALNVGATLTDSFTVTTIDGTTQVVTIMIEGVNDDAVIAGDFFAATIEAGGVANGIPGTPTGSGDLDATDVDDPSDSWIAVLAPTLSLNGYGSFTVSAAGVWTYTLDNTNAAVQSLNVDTMLTDVFTVTTVDGTAQLVLITIDGANDAPVAVSDSNLGDAVVESGVNPGNTPFAGDPSAAGNVLTNDTDVDDGDSKTVTALNGSAANLGIAVAGIYGFLTLTADGGWSYALDNADPDTDALAQGQAVNETFTYTMADGNGATSTTTLIIGITGTNDAPVAVDDTNAADAVIESGVNPGNTPFAGDPTATGNVLTNDTDVDSGDVLTVTEVNVLRGTVGLPLIGAFGTLIMSESGEWTYTLNDSDDDTEALGQGMSAVESFTYTITDAAGASAIETLTISITGTNDAPIALADHNGGDVVSPTNTTATGNVLDNDIDPDSGDTKSVIAVNGSAANIGPALVGIYGSLTLSSSGIWIYTLNTSDPDTLALEEDQTAIDSFSYTMVDANGATSSTSLDITVAGGDDPPYINTISTHNFVTPSEPGDIVFINGFTYQDADTLTGTVTVRIASSNPGDILNATSSGNVTVTGSGSSAVVLTGTMADINAYISGNNVRWDLPPGEFDRNFVLTVDENGAAPGGAVLSTTTFFNSRTLSFNDFGGDNVNLAGWNLNNVNVLLGFGTANDSVVTAWSHGPSSIGTTYDGGSGFDTITLTFTPAQLEAILANSFDRNTLQNYLDGDVSGPFGDNTLSLDNTSWNASATNFENASLALAAGPEGFVRFTAIGEDLPDFTLTPGITSGTSVGTAGADTISALAGNDVVAGLGGNDTLNGDAGSDMLLGGSGADTLRGGSGNDILSGGTGADRFVFTDTGGLNSDTIVDFSFVDGDTIDLSGLLDPAFSTGQPISGFVRAFQVGPNITVQVDIDGGGNSFVDVATLTSYGTNSPDIVKVTFEGADHILLV